MECCDENEMPVVPIPIDTSGTAIAEKEKKKDVDEAESVCLQFAHYYYDVMQKKPHLAGQLYLEDSVMLWDGNPVCSRDAIQKFIELKLPSLTFNMSSMDCQSINGAAVGTKKTFIISMCGQYRVSGVGTVRAYAQQIVITTDNDKWRIAVDNFRSQSSVCSSLPQL